MSLSLLIAHVGQWWIYPLYGIPVLIVVGASIRALIQERRERRGPEGTG